MAAIADTTCSPFLVESVTLLPAGSPAWHCRRFGYRPSDLFEAGGSLFQTGRLLLGAAGDCLRCPGEFLGRGVQCSALCADSVEVRLTFSRALFSAAANCPSSSLARTSTRESDRRRPPVPEQRPFCAKGAAILRTIRREMGMAIAIDKARPIRMPICGGARLTHQGQAIARAIVVQVQNRLQVIDIFLQQRLEAGRRSAPWPACFRPGYRDGWSLTHLLHMSNSFPIAFHFLGTQQFPPEQKGSFARFGRPADFSHEGLLSVLPARPLDAGR